ncbi:MAG TPA: methyltransferase domain-containing protein [Gemmatimonadaceae bacterium]|nr:methyltransferase domain-containing protein [Gemmatimonadaceae bacterium]
MRQKDASGAPPREWDARTYHTVSEPQFEWGKRVLATLELNGDEVVIDAGCGSGRLTTLLAERLPRGRVVAVDRSVNMVKMAGETLVPFGDRALVAAADLSNLPFIAAFDVVFSTATFHWIVDHDRLFASLFDALRAGGRVHAQCGGGTNLIRIHTRADALTALPEFASYFRDWSVPKEFADAETTCARLERAGFHDVDTNLEDAPFVFPDAQAFRTFVSTVVLRPYLAKLGDERLRDSFLDRITNAAAADSPAFELDYCRLNLAATKPR